MTVRDPYWSKAICAMPFLGYNDSAAFTDLCGGVVSVAGNAKQSTAVTKYLASSLYLDGVVDHVKVTNPLFNWGSSDFTICGWAYLTAYNGAANTLFNIGDGVGTNELVLRVQNNGKFYGAIYHGGAYQFQLNGNTVIPLGSWFHVAFVRSGDNHYIFLNGLLEMSTVKSHSLPSLAWTAYFGSLTESAYDQYRHIGYLSEFRVYKTAIGTPTTFPVPTGELGNVDPMWDNVLLYMQGQSFSDAKGHPVPTINATIASTRSRWFTNSIYFNGTNAYLTADWLSALLINNVTFTMDGWFFQETVQAGINVVFGFHTSAGGNRYVVCNDYVFGGDGNSINPPAFPEKLLNLGAWTHVMAVHDNGIITVFKNGSPLGSYANCLPNIVATDKFSVGQDWDAATPSDFFKGSASDIRVTLGARQPVGFFRITEAFANSNVKDPNFASNSILIHGDGPDLGINTPVVDSSPNNLTVVATGAVVQGTYSPFPIPTGSEYSADLNQGSVWMDSGYVQILNPGVITGNFTLEFWWNPITNLQAETNIFEMGLYTDGILLRSTSGIWVNGPNTASPGTLAPLGVWTHIAVVRIGGTIYIYKNGNLYYTASNGSTLNAANGSIVFASANHSLSQLVRAYLADVHFINGAAKYTGNFALPVAPAPLFDNGSVQSRCLLKFKSAKMKDYAGKANLYLTGTAKISTARSVFSVGSSIFVGNGTVEWPFSSDFAFNGDFTIECFFWTSVDTGDQPLFQTNGGANALSLYFALRNAAVEVDAQGVTPIMSSVSAGLNTWKKDQWNHIALCRISGVMTLWVNKCAVFSVSNSVSFTQPSSTRCSFVIPGGYVAEYRITKGLGRYQVPVLLSPPLFAAPTRHSLGSESRALSGNVLAPGGVSNKIRAYSRARGDLVAETYSDPITGAFSMSVDTVEEHTVLCFDNNRNALVLDRVIPL